MCVCMCQVVRTQERCFSLMASPELFGDCVNWREKGGGRKGRREERKNQRKEGREKE